MRRIAQLYWDNRKIVLLTAEIFWIVAFLLDEAARASGSDVAQFVYVNF